MKIMIGRNAVGPSPRASSFPMILGNRENPGETTRTIFYVKSMYFLSETTFFLQPTIIIWVVPRAWYGLVLLLSVKMLSVFFLRFEFFNVSLLEKIQIVSHISDFQVERQPPLLSRQTLVVN